MGNKEARIQNLRFSLVKNSYYFSANVLSNLTGYGTGSAINNLETGSSRLSYGMVTAFQKVFCVSADWLLNHDVPPYQEEIVHDGEKALFDRLMLDDVGKSFYEVLPPQYKDYMERKRNYSLEARANLVVLTYYTRCYFSFVIEEALKNCSDKLTFYDILSNSMLLDNLCQTSGKTLSRRKKEILTQYAMLMAGKIKNPIYKLNY